MFSEEALPSVRNIKPHSIGVHSISISWDSIPVVETIGYKIIYHPLKDNQTTTTITVHSDMTNYRIAGLERSQTYCVRVLAYNEYGDGEISNCTEVTTAQGKLICSY